MYNKLPRIALRTSLLYWLIAALWILVSDWALVSSVSDPKTMGNLAMVKDWVFVTVTAVLLFVTLRSQLQRWEREAAARQQAERGLAEEAIRRRILIDQSRDGIVVLDQNGKVYEANQRYAEMLGYSAQEVRELHVWDWDVQWTREQLLEKIRLVDISGDPFETRHRRKDGTFIDVEISANGAELAGQKLVFCVCRDISQRKAAEKALREREEVYSAILNQAADGIVLIDTETLRFAEFNDEACHGLGYTREEFSLLTLSETQGIFAEEEVRHRVEEIVNAGGGTFENLQRRKDGTLRNVKVADRVVHIRGQNYLAAVWHDITARKRLEAEREITVRLLALLNSSNSLSDLVREVTQLLLDWSGCEAAGIRLRQDGDFPYFETRGFPPEFVRAESQLCRRDPEGKPVRDSQGNPVLECMCENVLSGRFNPDKPFFTKRGSFWTNCTSELLASTTEADRQPLTCNRCNGKGYESVALVAIRTGIVVHGLLQFNDRRKGRFSLEAIEFLERLADHLANSIANRLSQENLRQNEERLSLVISGTRAAVWDWNVQSGETIFDERYAEIVGYSLEELQPISHLTWLKLAHPDDVKRQNELLRRHFSREIDHYDLECRMRHKNGSWIWVHDRGKVVSWTADGKPLRMTGTHTDISQRKQAEEALRQSERQLRELADAMPQLIWMASPNGETKYYNRRAEEYIGLLPDPEGKLRWQSALHPDDVHRSEEAWQCALRTGNPYEIEHRTLRKDGVYRWHLSRAVPIHDEAGCILRWYGTATDIHEKKLSEEALRESEGRLNLALASSQMGVWEWKVQTNEVFWSSECYEMVGMGRFDNRMESFMSLVHPEDISRVRTALRQALENKTDYHAEFRLICPDGKVLWLFNLGRAEYDDHGRPFRMVGTVHDITVRKQAEAAIEERLRLEERLSRVAAAVPGVVYAFRMRLDGSVHFPYASPAIEEIFGLRPEDVVNDAAAAFHRIHPDDVTHVNESILESARMLLPWRDEFRVQHPRKGEIFVEGRSTPEREPDGSILWSGFAHDVTERVQLEGQLRQAKKMESLGQLSGGIAHDFNNILAAILGNAQLARMDINSGHPAMESIDAIIRAGKRAKNLVQQILAFAQQQPGQHHVIALRPVVEESLRLLRATLPAGVELTTSLADDTPDVLADSTQVQQAILNLGTNAWHSLEGRPGRISLALCGLDVDSRLAQSHADLRPGRYARLSVIDTGTGMDAATLEHVFDPFFTTKEPGQGTGLGLSVVHGIMKDNLGAVTVTSQPGQGTTFHLYFPAVEAELETASSLPALPSGGRGQHLLYLDDERDLVELATRVLGRLGYHVSGFTRPQDALNAFRENPQQFDLVITDLSMPVTSGLEVASELLAIRPGMPVVLSSGYISEELRDAALRIGIRELVYKPNTVEGLCDAIHRVISQTKHP